MKKAVIISDSFKGTLTSGEICAIARACFQQVLPDWEAVCVPVADGGEGTVACFQEACGGQTVTCTVQGPYGQPVQAAYLRLSGGQAVIEMASCAGLPLVGERKDPGKTTTYGVGEQIRRAVEAGSTSILLGLGGSCTNDGGCGAAAALGVRFLDADGRSFIPTGGTLDRIARIETKEAEALLAGVRLTAMCDIDNPLCGPTGAAAVFGPQKGADPAMVEFLDGQLRALDETVRRELGRAAADLPGAGAAGGLGFGVSALLGGTLRPGIEAVLDLVNFDALLEGCGLVFTGEGRLDGQSLRGKVISGVGRRAAQKGVPVVAVVGGVEPDTETICARPELGIRAVFSINRQAVDFAQSRHRSRENYRHTFENILRLIDTAERLR